MKTETTYHYTHIKIVPVPGNLEDIVDRYSEYNRTVDKETALALAAPAMLDLLRRAAEKLHDYCAEANGDINDALAMDIEQVIGDLK